jgi:transcriptional regulator with PAS, ATPase and Fis domain
MAKRAVPEALVQKLLGNPFALSAPALKQAALELAARTLADAERWPEPRTSKPAVATPAARSGVLAVLHARALLHRPLYTSSSAGREHKRVPEQTRREARAALASARCVTRLARLAGVSEALDRVRRDTWAASFGRTLVHGLVLERVVRSHDVLITGETGSGKEELAHAIVEGLPGDADGAPAPHAEINAAAVPDTLLESELFGYVRGAFTGAHEARKGLVRSADGGCLFLDEVGDLPLSAQAKLLRVIETDRVQPLGSDQLHAVDVRFVAATHHDLAERACQGSFRADLYQRLAAVVIKVPPLRERPEDIPLIGEHFLARALDGVPRELDLDVAAITRWLRSAEARNYAWPGNARELRNVVSNLLLGLPTALTTDHEPDVERLPQRLARAELTLGELERWYIDHVARRVDGNLARAARKLGIDRSTVARKLRSRQ